MPDGKPTAIPPQPAAPIRWAVFLVLTLLALAIRLPQLEVRPMHTDESVNAFLTGKLLDGGHYQYDAQDRHGPALTEIALPLARLQGATRYVDLTETQLRLTPVLAGVAIILLLGAAVDLFGFIPCLLAALWLAVAPLPVYYSRYFIHETLFVTATLGLILTGWRALRTRALLPALLAGGFAAFMFACKETVVINFFTLAVAAAACWFVGNKKRLPPPRTWLAAALAFAVAGLLLFTWGGKNWAALAELLQAIPNFTARAGGQGHEKPFGYYFRLLTGGWSGAALLVLAALGLYRVTDSSRRFFLAVYAGLTALIYSAIPYKTPWLALNFWWPLALLAGFAGERLWFACLKLPARALLLALLAGLLVLMGHDTRRWVFQKPADEKNPYAYAHTTEDLLDLPPRLAEAARERGLAAPEIAVVAADAWPLPWYLRKFPRTGFWQPGQEPGAADFYITTTDVPENLQARLEKFSPEFFGVRPNVLLILWVPMTTPVAPATPPVHE